MHQPLSATTRRTWPAAAVNLAATAMSLTRNKGKWLLGDAVAAAQVTLGLVSGVLDAVDVVALLDQAVRVADADMMEIGCIQGVAGAERAGADDAVGPDFLFNDRRQGFSAALAMVTA